MKHKYISFLAPCKLRSNWNIGFLHSETHIIDIYHTVTGYYNITTRV